MMSFMAGRSVAVNVQRNVHDPVSGFQIPSVCVTLSLLAPALYSLCFWQCQCVSACMCNCLHVNGMSTILMWASIDHWLHLVYKCEYVCVCAFFCLCMRWNVLFTLICKLLIPFLLLLLLNEGCTKLRCVCACVFCERSRYLAWNSKFVQFYLLSNSSQPEGTEAHRGISVSENANLCHLSFSVPVFVSLSV